MSLLLALGRTSTWHHQASAQVDVYWHLVLPGFTACWLQRGRRVGRPGRQPVGWR